MNRMARLRQHHICPLNLLPAMSCGSHTTSRSGGRAFSRLLITARVRAALNPDSGGGRNGGVRITGNEKGPGYVVSARGVGQCYERVNVGDRNGRCRLSFIMPAMAAAEWRTRQAIGAMADTPASQPLNPFEVAHTLPIRHSPPVSVRLVGKEVCVMRHHIRAERRTRQFAPLKTPGRLLQTSRQHRLFRR